MRRPAMLFLAAVGAALLFVVGVGVATADDSTCPPGQSVTDQGYCSPVVTPTPGTSTSTPTTPATVGTTTSSVAGTNTSVTNTPAARPIAGVAGVQASIHAARRTGTLPFTGLQLTIFALVGMGLIAGGYLLRTAGRRRGSNG